jgi:predicted nucleic acid-binding protein
LGKRTFEEAIVCNTGPLIALSVIDRLTILHHLFQTVIVPESVNEEIKEGGANNSGLSNYMQANWIKIIPVSGTYDPLLAAHLDVGEASVIQLASELGLNEVLFDERKARKIARHIYNLNVIGTAGILLEAKRKGLIDNIASEIGKMRDSGYWIGDSIVEAVLKQAGEI